MVLYDSLPRLRRSISAAAALEDKCDNPAEQAPAPRPELLQRHSVGVRYSALRRHLNSDPRE